MQNKSIELPVGRFAKQRILCVNSQTRWLDSPVGRKLTWWERGFCSSPSLGHDIFHLCDIFSGLGLDREHQYGQVSSGQPWFRADPGRFKQRESSLCIIFSERSSVGVPVGPRLFAPLWYLKASVSPRLEPWAITCAWLHRFFRSSQQIRGRISFCQRQ